MASGAGIERGPERFTSIGYSKENGMLHLRRNYNFRSSESRSDA